MAPVIGFTFLLAILFIGLFLPIFNFTEFKKGISLKSLDNFSITIVTLTFICAVFAQLSLIYSFVISDYSVKNIYQNSHHFKPLIYKISASWGNHEGSMLLLIVIISGYNLIFNFLSRINIKQKLIITSCQSFIVALFAAFTIFSSNPFERIFPVPLNGLGLNPILQDIGLALHPPMLYTGYLGFSLIFSFAIAGLLTEKINREFASYLKPWLFFTWSFLSLGIGLGAWWAYRELGWGGYWFWDPVENVSLMPWLVATALIHCLMLLEKKETFKTWTIFLSILTFILCLLGIFLVRCGILTSVHAFAIDASRGFFIIALLTIIGGSGLFIFGQKIGKIKSEKKEIIFSSKLGSILFNNYFLVIALFIVLLGTTYPIFLRSFFDEFITIGPSYYNQVFSLLIIPFLIFLAITTNLNYEKNSSITQIFNRKLLLIFLASCLISCLSFFYENEVKFLQFIILTLAYFAALSNLLNKQNLIAKLAHCGFCLIIIGIVLTSSFGLTKEINLKENESTKIGEYELKFEKTSYDLQSNFVARQGDFSILKNQKIIGKLSPELRYYPISSQTTNESSIRHGFFGDLYLVIGNKDEEENYALRIYYKPFIYLIWVGCLMIFIAGILNIFIKKNEYF